MKWSCSKNENANEIWVLGRLTNANAGKIIKVVHATNANAAIWVPLVCLKCKYDCNGKKEAANCEEMKMSNYDRSNCKCNVNVTNPARYHNTGQIGHKLLFI